MKPTHLKAEPKRRQNDKNGKNVCRERRRREKQIGKEIKRLRKRIQEEANIWKKLFE